MSRGSTESYGDVEVRAKTVTMDEWWVSHLGLVVGTIRRRGRNWTGSSRPKLVSVGPVSSKQLAAELLATVALEARRFVASYEAGR